MNNETPASATGAAGLKKQVFFGPQSTSNTSGTFSVGPEPFYIRAFNLNSGDTITVQAVGGTGSGTAFAAYAPLGAPITLSPGNPQVRLDWPGQYRLVFQGASVTSILCDGYAAVSTEPSIYTYGGGGGSGSGFALVAANSNSINLNFTGTTAGGTLTATAKISAVLGNTLSINPDGLFSHTVIQVSGLLNISGNGTTGSPYDIGTTLAVLPYPNLSAQPDGLISNAGFGTIIYIVDSPFQHCDIFGGERSSNSNGETCVGFSSGAATVGALKTCIGHSALANGTTAASGGFAEDVAVGYQAGLNVHKNTSLSGPGVFIGPNAGAGCTYSQIVAVGNLAGQNAVGNSLVAIGVTAGQGLTGTDNVIVGNSAAAGTLTITDSVIIGQESAQGIAAGSNIIAIGKAAGEGATVSDGNMYIGARAGFNETHSNVIIIATGAATTNATNNNQIILGKLTHTELRTAGSIISGGVIGPSDERLKQDIAPLTGALAKIESLRVVSFQWNQDALDASKLPYLETDMRKTISGVIAQEVKKVIPEAVESVQGGDGEKYFYLRPDRFLGYMLGALQELSQKNAALEARIAALEKGN